MSDELKQIAQSRADALTSLASYCDQLRADAEKLCEALELADKLLNEFLPDSCDVYIEQWEAKTKDLAAFREKYPKGRD